MGVGNVLRYVIRRNRLQSGTIRNIPTLAEELKDATQIVGEIAFGEIRLRVQDESSEICLRSDGAAEGISD